MNSLEKKWQSLLGQEQKLVVTIEERSFEFQVLEKRINPDNLIYKYKCKEVSLLINKILSKSDKVSWIFKRC